MEYVPFLAFLFLFIMPICGEIPLGGPDPEVDEHVHQYFQGHTDAFMAGMKDGFAELQKESEEKAARGEEGSDNLVNPFKPESVAQFVVNWIPERIRVLLPKEWLIKLIKALTIDGSAIVALYNGADRVGSSDEFWRELRKKAPTTTELLDDAWAEGKRRWDKFNGMLNDESKQYVEKVKNTGWTWFVRQVVGPFVRLPNDAKTNLTLSLFEAYPLLGTVLSKMMANRTLLEWAGEWYKKAEGQIRKGEETNEKEGVGKEGLNEDSMMAQMKEMFKRMNLGDLDDLMGGMEEEEEEQKGEEWEEDEETKEEGKEEEEEEKGVEEAKQEEGEEGEGEEGAQCSNKNEQQGQCAMAKEGDHHLERGEKNTGKEERDEL